MEWRNLCHANVKIHQMEKLLSKNAHRANLEGAEAFEHAAETFEMKKCELLRTTSVRINSAFV